MNSVEARKFVEDWFNKIWLPSSVENLKLFYDENVKITANGTARTRDDLIKHCQWCKENEKITKFDILDVVAEGNTLAFRFKYEYSNKTQKGLAGENIVIMHVNDNKKIIQVDVKSSEVFGTE